MDIRHLKYFIEVARQKSFSRAAETLHISQSAVSKMIKDTEQEIGLLLFTRNSKTIQLTDSGETFLLRAQEIVSLFDNLVLEVESEAKLDKGQISIGLPPITGATPFAKLLGQFKKKYPQIGITLFEYGSKTTELGIQNSSLDIGIICNSKNIDAYHVFSLSNDPLWVIAHPEHPISKLSEINLAALRHEQFVIYPEDFSLHHDIVNSCRESGFQPSIILATSQRELMTQIVAANLGIALLPSKICVDLDPRYLTAIPLIDPKIYHKMSIIWKKGRYLPHAAHLWIEFAQEYLLKQT